MSAAQSIHVRDAFAASTPVGSFVRTTRHHRHAACLAAALSAAVPLFAVPQAGWAQIEEVVVTARKREESLQDVPLAVENFSAEEIERKGLNDIADLATQSASIKFDQGTNRSDTRLSIRGISPTRGRQNASINVDGVDVSSEAIQSSGGSILINQRLISLQRVEIIKGPQIALWGRSAFNGALNFVTKDPPEELAGEITADGNQEDQYSLKGEIGTPIFGEKLGVMLTGGWWDEEGFYQNTVTGEDIGGEEGYGFALKTKSEFGNGLTIRTRAAYEHYEYEVSPEAIIRFNTLARQPQSALAGNSAQGILPTFTCLPRVLVGDPNFPYADDDDLPLLDESADFDPDNPNDVTDRLRPNQTLIDRYTTNSLDPDNPTIPDNSPCQEVIPLFTGTVPDGDKLKTELATNPFTPGKDYEGTDGDTIRLALIAEWEVGQGVFSSWTGYTHDDNSEFQDNGKYADCPRDASGNCLRDPDNPFIVTNVNLSHADIEKFTRQFSQELRYATRFDGPVNVTMGGNYWEEDVDTDSRNLTHQASGNYCFYSSNTLDNPNALGFFGAAPDCPGYTELPIGPFVAGGQFDWGDGSDVYPGIDSPDSPCRDLTDPDANGDCVRNSSIDRSTEHRSFYGMVEIQTGETTKLTLEGRYSHEDLTVTGAKFLNPFAAGGPQSWAACGAPGRPCDMSFLTSSAGPFWSPTNFQSFYDVWRPFAPVRTGSTLLQIDAIPEECLSDPDVQARLQQIEDTGTDPFDLMNPFCIGQLDRTDDWFSPKITLDWKPNPESLIYVYWARAEKPGGFTLFTIGASGLRRDLAEFEPEKLDTYEIGGNTTVLDNTLLLNGAVFFNDYTDKQVLVNDRGPDGRSISKIANAPAELWGAEISVTWQPITTFLGGAWGLNGSYSYIHSEYTDFIDEFATSENAIGQNHFATGRSCTPTVKTTIVDTGAGPVTVQTPACSINWEGMQFERSPEHSVVGTISYTVPLGAELETFAELGVQWKDEQPLEFDNVSWLDAYWNLDFRLGLQAPRWEVIGYVTNLLDDDTIRSASNQPGLSCCFNLGISQDVGGFGSLGTTAEVPLARAAFLPPPRIVGLRATYRFGGIE